MTICIEYNDKPLFDIEWYLALNESNNLSYKDNKWYSEISCHTCIKGVSEYLNDNFKKEKFNLEDFIKDSEVIENIRGWLHEKHNNRYAPIDLASNRHYNEFSPELKSIIENYSNKYGFIVHTD